MGKDRRNRASLLAMVSADASCIAASVLPLQRNLPIGAAGFTLLRRGARSGESKSCESWLGGLVVVVVVGGEEGGACFFPAGELDGVGDDVVEAAGEEAAEGGGGPGDGGEAAGAFVEGDGRRPEDDEDVVGREAEEPPEHEASAVVGAEDEAEDGGDEADGDDDAVDGVEEAAAVAELAVVSVAEVVADHQARSGVEVADDFLEDEGGRGHEGEDDDVVGGARVGEGAILEDGGHGEGPALDDEFRDAEAPPPNGMVRVGEAQAEEGVVVADVVDEVVEPAGRAAQEIRA
mmetsp:Transcript_19795/g.63657  ORF Transcript_19795/g.63657 Transcript_19795/m.63657 type:complete len:291 (-) Transcript_19795:888-1760(-)